MEMKNLHAGDLWLGKMLKFLCLNADFSAEVLIISLSHENLSDALPKN